KPLAYELAHQHADRLVTVQPREDGLVVAVHDDSPEPWSGDLVLQRVSYDGDVLASATVPVEVEARGIVVVPVPADVATPDDAAVELVTATLGDVRGVRFLAEPRDSRLASEPGLTVDATVAEGPDGFVTT
ncbi:hypothetical protein JG669_08675, partial [Campylobacter jejuni]